MTSAREQLARLLAADQPPSTSSVQYELPPDSMHLQIDGVGTVSFPIRAAQAKRLISAAEPAMFGHREETILDTRVRDTWQIDTARVNLGGAWNERLDELLEHTAHGLGMSRATKLRAELHSLLIYGKGQFFAPHQDSEKNEQMIATLVVQLPSIHTGGELVVATGSGTVRDAGAQRYYGSDHELRCVAFYSNCEHEVKPVRLGYRATLTFNLLAEIDEQQLEIPDAVAAADLLRAHFETPAHTSWGKELGQPNKLVYLLEHKYSQRGLAADNLKGTDAAAIAVLRTAAELADYEVELALAELHEVRDAIDYDDDLSADGPLITDDAALGWWTIGGGEKIELGLSDHEICASTPNQRLQPDHSEYEGYMGNYGNTVEHWYRRAAAVVWPREKQFAVRAEASADWALRQLQNMLHEGEVKSARAAAESIMPNWTHEPDERFGDALEVACRLEDAALARSLLSAFELSAVLPEHAAEFSQLVQQHGESFLDELLTRWFTERWHKNGAIWQWIEELLVPFSEVLTGAGTGIGTSDENESAGHTLARFAEYVWQWLLPQLQGLISQRGTRDARAEALAGRASALASLCRVATHGLSIQIASDLREMPNQVVRLLLPAVLSLPANLPLHLRALRSELAAIALHHLDEITSRRVRDADDWSIEWRGCGCSLCTELEAFLDASDLTRKDWPIAEAKRQHIHMQIENADLPLSHQTRREGRPYTLVLNKLPALFDREAAERRFAKAAAIRLR